MVRLACVLTLAVILTAANTAQASGPVGGYVTVDKVVLTPADDPTTIQIWGSFVLATSEKTYGKPERGYLYYKAFPGTEALCRKEWADLKKSAGTAQVIGFGSSYSWEAMGKVRTGVMKLSDVPLLSQVKALPEQARNYFQLATPVPVITPPMAFPR